MKSNKKFLLLIGAVFLLLFWIESSQPKPIDWSPGFSKDEKKPLGDYLLFEMLPAIFNGQNIQSVNKNIIDQLDEDKLQNSKDINYIFVNDVVDFNEYEATRLLDFVQQGHHVFIASSSFSDTLLSLLALKQMSIYEGEAFLYATSIKDSLFHFNFCDNIKTIDTGYAISKEFSSVSYYFDSIQGQKKMLAADTLHHCVLTEIKYGKGHVILCTLPHAFTNYYILKPSNLDFILQTLTRMPLQTVWWDEHYKSGRAKDTPLRYILDNSSLKWAYYLMLIGLMLFVLFMGKRRQRIIPRLDPMKNTSLEFAETIGQVYYEKGDHINLAQKKVNYFKEYLRAKYMLNLTQYPPRNSTDFLVNLSNKTGRSVSELKTLFEYISYIENTLDINEKELIYLNTLIERFKSPSKSN